MERVEMNLVCLWDRPNFNPWMSTFSETNDSFHLLRSYRVSDAVLNTLHVLAHLIILSSWEVGNYTIVTILLVRQMKPSQVK